MSTRDSRSREQREAERKTRQLEKLPKPEALHDFEYPNDKTLLNDQWFQAPVYDDQLDTPQLFQLFPPTDFFVRWNAADFERSVFPPLPPLDHRTLSPKSAEWKAHQAKMGAYLEKHAIRPLLFETVRSKVNASFVFDSDEEAPKAFTPANFWKTAHAGNYIPLSDVQKMPRIAFGPDAGEGSLYTAMIVSPDYPHRVGAAKAVAGVANGYFLHAVRCNISPQNGDSGTQVVDWVPPLPTEDAGTTRHLCLLFKQTEAVAAPKPSKLSFAHRCSYRMHDGVHTSAELRAVEGRIDNVIPEALTFFQTSWDIQVQEFYEGAGLPEPQYWPEDVEAILKFNALPLDFHQVRTRRNPDGSINEGTTMHHHTKLNDSFATMQHMSVSRKTLRGPDGRALILPKK